MKALAVLLAVFISKAAPIELWRTPLPSTLVEIRLAKDRRFYAPTPLYFKNLQLGCALVAKSLSEIADCQRLVKDIARLSSFMVAEAIHADKLRNWGLLGVSDSWSLRALEKAALEAADKSAAPAERSFDELLRRYPALPAFGRLPKRREA